MPRCSVQKVETKTVHFKDRSNKDEDRELEDLVTQLHGLRTWDSSYAAVYAHLLTDSLTPPETSQSQNINAMAQPPPPTSTKRHQHTRIRLRPHHHHHLLWRTPIQPHHNHSQRHLCSSGQHVPQNPRPQSHLQLVARHLFFSLAHVWKAAHSVYSLTTASACAQMPWTMYTWVVQQ